MKAIRQHRHGGPETLHLETLPDPFPGPGQVRLRVLAAGVHLLDVHVRSGLGPPRAQLPLPMTPGREVAGIVDATAPDVDPSWEGQFVATDLGTASGGYAELAVADAEKLHRLADHVDPAEAVAALGTGRTVQAILELAQVRTGDTVVVTGASGGVGGMLITAAKTVGATVLGLATGEDKRLAVAGLGVDALDSSTDDWPQEARRLLGDAGANLVLDGIGGALGTHAMSLLGVDGRLVMFGTASGTAILLDAETIYSMGITVSAAVGARLFARPGGLRDLEQRALLALEDGSLVPLIGHRISLSRADDAHRAMEDRRSFGKVVLLPDEIS